MLTPVFAVVIPYLEIERVMMSLFAELFERAIGGLMKESQLLYFAFADFQVSL